MRTAITVYWKTLGKHFGKFRKDDDEFWKAKYGFYKRSDLEAGNI